MDAFILPFSRKSKKPLTASENLGFFPAVITHGECSPAQRAEGALTSCAADQPNRAGA